MSSAKQLVRTNREPASILGSCVPRRILLLLFICGGAFFNSGLSFGQDSDVGTQIDSPEAPLTDRTEVDVAQLSRGDYAARHQATLNMWKNRDLSRSAVQRAARDEDPEIAGRAKWILRQWRRGALPETPPEISRLLNDSDGQSAILRLIENGQFHAAVIAVEESAGTPMREAISRRVTTAVMQRFPVYANLAMENDSLGSLLQLIDLVAETPEMSLCRIRLMQHLDIPIDDESILPKSSSAWPKMQQQQTRIALLAVLGQFDAAVELGIQSNHPELIRRCQMIAGDWQSLKNDALQAATSESAEEQDTAKWKHWSDVLVAASRMGDTATVQEAVSRLTLSESDHERLDAISAMDHADQQWQRPWNLRWRSLAMHGNLDPAMQVVAKIAPDDLANLWLTVSQPGNAFKSLNMATNQIDRELHEWIEEALEEQTMATTPSLVPKTQRLLALMQGLLLVGRDDSAWLIASRLSVGNELDNHPGSAGDLLSNAVLDGLSNAGRTDWAFKLAMQMDMPPRTKRGEESISASRMAAIAGALPETDEDTLEVILAALQSLQPKRDFASQLDSAGQLLRGQIPDDFDPDTDFRRFFNFVSRPRPTRTIAARFARSATLRGNMQIVLMFSRLDQPDFASTLLRALAQSGDPDAILEVANRALDSGDLDSAEVIFQSIRKSATLGGNQNSLFAGGKAHRIASYPSLTITGKALVGQWIIARSRNDDTKAALLRQEIEVLLCGPSMALRRSVADSLSKRGENAWAADVYEGMLASSWFDPQESLDFYQDTRRFALLANDTNPSAAARWFDLAMIQIIDSDEFRPTAFVTLPVYVHRWSLEAAIKNKDTVEAEYQINELLKLDPMDLDLSERLLPPMRDAGMNELADQTLLNVLQRCEAHAKEFPNDAITLNNVAWVAAVNRKHLDRAFDLSRQSVRTEPDSAIYRDTLAEILYLKGQADQAIQIEKDCVLDDPGEWRLHEQIQRFSSQEP